MFSVLRLEAISIRGRFFCAYLLAIVPLAILLTLLLLQAGTYSVVLIGSVDGVDIAVSGVVIGIATTLLMWRFANISERQLHQLVDTAKLRNHDDVDNALPFESEGLLDEIRMAITEICTGKQKLAGDISAANQELAFASEQLGNAASSSSEGATEQRKAVQYISSSINDMSKSIEVVNETAQITREMAENSAELAKKGEADVSYVNDDVKSIHGALEETTAVLDSLNARSEQVGTIISTIKNIAEQTNLLALNAAIEAARAGEQGRGFAVVADEVRELASRTNNSSTEVSTLIKGIQDEVSAIATSVSTVSESVSSSLSHSSDADESLAAISSHIEQTVEKICDIAMAMNVQSAASKDIAAKIEHINEMASVQDDSIRQVAETTSYVNEISGKITKSLQADGGQTA